MNRLLLVWALLMLGCSSADDDFEAACEANTVRDCACESGELGKQSCVTDGSKWSACSCEPGGGAGTSGTGGGGPTTCEEDDECSFPSACIESVCAVATWAEPGEPCDAPDTRCVLGATCADGNYCVVP
jgi:hypothetical protein